MPEQQFLTVKQFAAAAGVTTQRIYQALANSLQSYCKVENGRKYIDSAALQVFAADADLPSDCKAFTKRLQSADFAMIDKLRAEIAAAQQSAAVAAAERDAERRRADAAEAREAAQLQTVAALTAALQTAQKQAADLTEALTAAQALHAGTIQERLTVQDGEQVADNQTEKRGLFRRIFGRK